MAAAIQATGSQKTATRSRPRRPEAGFAAAAGPERPSRRRSRATFFSRRVRYDAVWGESGMTCQATTEAMTEGKPSTRKSSRQGAMGPRSANPTMAHARVAAKLVARGAAVSGQRLPSERASQKGGKPPEMNMAVRNASSSRRKKKLR